MMKICIALFFFGGFAFLCGLNAGEEGMPWKNINSVEMKTDISCEFTGDFIKYNDRPEIHKVNKRIEHVTVKSIPDRYLISRTTSYADNSMGGVEKMGFGGEYTFTLSNGTDRVLSVTKRKSAEISTTFLGSDALMFPFNFLFKKKESANADTFLWSDVGAVQDFGLWKSILDARPVEYNDARFGRLSYYEIQGAGYVDQVSLSRDYHNLPIYITRVDKEFKKIVKYSAEEVAKVQEGDAFLQYASRSSLWFYLSDWEIVQYKHSVKEVLINREIEEEEFQMDPSLATYIWDADTKMIISVPR